MSVLGIRQGEGDFAINNKEGEQLLSSTDQAINAKAIGILGKHPVRDTCYAFLFGGAAGTFVSLAVLLSNPPNYGQAAFTALPAGFIGGAVGAVVASLANRIITNGKVRPIWQTIPSMIGASLAILGIANVCSWHINHQILPLWEQFLIGVPSCIGAAVINSSIKHSSASFFLGLGVGSAAGLGAGVGLGMLLPAIGPSLGGMYGSLAGMAGSLGIFDLNFIMS